MASSGLMKHRQFSRYGSLPHREKGKANKAVTALIAAHLGLPKAAVTLVSGNTSQQKLVEISGMPEAEIRQRLS